MLFATGNSYGRNTARAAAPDRGHARRLLFGVWCCDVRELFLWSVLCAKKMYVQVGTAVYSMVKKRYIQNRNTPDLVRVRIYSKNVVVLMLFTYAFVFVIIRSS